MCHFPIEAMGGFELAVLHVVLLIWSMIRAITLRWPGEKHQCPNIRNMNVPWGLPATSWCWRSLSCVALHWLVWSSPPLLQLPTNAAHAPALLPRDVGLLQTMQLTPSPSWPGPNFPHWVSCWDPRYPSSVACLVQKSPKGSCLVCYRSCQCTFPYHVRKKVLRINNTINYPSVVPTKTPNKPETQGKQT